MNERTATIVGVLSWLVPAVPGLAQAWVPPAGHGAVAVAVQAIDNTGHVLANGETVPSGLSRNAAVFVDVDYAITDRISVAASLPYVFARFDGPPLPNVPVPPNDACHCWQQGFQDVGVTARFNLLNGATALTPSIAVGIPSHAYEYVGEAVLGRRLKEVRAALDAGVRLDAISPRLAFTGRYSYAWVEEAVEVGTNRSNVAVEATLELTAGLSVEVGVHRQVTHGGLRPGNDIPPPGGIPWGEITTPDQLRQHDRILRDDSWRLAAGAAYAWPSAQVFVSYLEFLGGSVTHDGRALTVGVAMPFARR
jgi:hypothetical protein